MTSSEFVANDNVTLSAVESKEWARVTSFTRVFQYICLALGIPGNILSATVWLRLHKKNSSAVYLAVLAINDIVFLLCDFTAIFTHYGSWLFRCVNYLWISSGLIEPLLVLGFSVERLLAVCWPLQVRLGICVVHVGPNWHFRCSLARRLLQDWIGFLKQKLGLIRF